MIGIIPVEVLRPTTWESHLGHDDNLCQVCHCLEENNVEGCMRLILGLKSSFAERDSVEDTSSIMSFNFSLIDNR